MKHQSKWRVTVDKGDKLDERIIPAKTERQAAERCETVHSRVILVERYEGNTKMDRPAMECLFAHKKRYPAY